MSEEVGPFPVREYQGAYEVLIVPENMWLRCHAEQDARAIAAAPVLELQSLGGSRTGRKFAAELEKTADALEKHRIGFGSRFFRQRAEEARTNSL